MVLVVFERVVMDDSEPTGLRVYAWTKLVKVWASLRWSDLQAIRPGELVLLELAEELAAKKCDLNLTWIRRDLNQLADDLTNEKFDMFDPEFRVPLKGEDMRWRVLDKLLSCADNFY